jgi:hypothetical protein
MELVQKSICNSCKFTQVQCCCVCVFLVLKFETVTNYRLRSVMVCIKIRSTTIGLMMIIIGMPPLAHLRQKER